MLKCHTGIFGSVIKLKPLFLLTIIALFISQGCSFNTKVLLFRKAFDSAGETINDELQKHIPEGVTSIRNVNYIPSDTNAFMDIYYPESTNTAWNERPAILWIHGGGWIAGSKNQIASYSTILAHRGYTVVAANYSLAPESQYPIPVIQLNNALAFLTKHSSKYKFNSKRIVIAGDSGGAQIAAQLGIALTDSAYAKTLGIVPSVPRSTISGMILFCGIYNFNNAVFGKEGVLLRMMLRAYSGSAFYKKKSDFILASVASYIPNNYPPTFISTGNNDVLKRHSYKLADTLKVKGVPVDELFFKNNRKVSLGHEYQFNLDDESGKLALERTVRFLKSLD